MRGVEKEGKRGSGRNERGRKWEVKGRKIKRNEGEEEERIELICVSRK